jgi:hypothetical protein
MSGLKIVCEACGAPIEAQLEIQQAKELLDDAFGLLCVPPDETSTTGYKTNWRAKREQWFKKAGYESKQPLR